MKNIENKVLPLLSSPSTTEMLCLPQRRLLRRHLCPHPRHLLVLHQSLDYIQETLNYLPQLSIFLRYKPGSSSGKELRKLWQADRTLAWRTTCHPRSVGPHYSTERNGTERSLSSHYSTERNGTERN